MEEQLDFILGDSAVVELLGRQNFSNAEAAVLELVKNSFDAGAENCEIILSEDSLTIIDDGKGMNYSVIRNNWMVIGKSDKEYIEAGRVLSGSKGVGRFAIARLGDNIVLETKKKDNEPLKWRTNWNKNLLSSGSKIDTGTVITICDLRDRWNKKLINTVVDFLNRTYNDKTMKITFYTDDKPIEIKPLYVSPKLGENFVSKINLNFNSVNCTLQIDISSDEFLPTVGETTGLNTSSHTESLFIPDILEKDMKNDHITNEILKQIGDFNAELYFSPSSVQVDDAQTFKYKYRKLPERFNQGVVLYRNSFSISSLEGKKDWLGINIRARKSPAAATHLTGQWRVRANQLSGKIKIDKINNKYLLDIANRQGLEENVQYDYFVKIVQLGLDSFEKFRQNIIRSYANETGYYEKPVIPEDETIKKFLSKPEKVRNFTDQETMLLATGIQTMKVQMVRQEKYAENLKQEYIYDTRILNLLATQGLRGMSVAHDLHTNRNSLVERPDMIEEIIKNKGLWDELDNPKKSYLSVPYHLKHLKGEIQPLLVFLDAMLSQNTKKAFTVQIHSIADYFDLLKERWNSEIENITFEIVDKGSNDELNTYLDVLDVIFDNLILNSYQQNMHKSDLKIVIQYEIIENDILFSYSDNGPGLNKTYLKNPFRILEVHESSRDEGHGLGMWLVNRTIISENGEITFIGNDDGFLMNFKFSGVKNGKQ